MSTDGERTPSARSLPARVGIVAQVALGTFVAAVLLEHVLVSRLSPATHQISEYANDPDAGWVMTVGFVAWSVSLGCAAVRSRSAQSKASSAVSWLLLLASAAMLLTAAFHTQTVAGVVPVGHRLTTSGRLHDLGSGITTLALLGAASLSVFALRDSRPFQRFVCVGVVVAVGSDAGLLLIGQSVGGIRERILVAIGCTWQATYLTLKGRSGERPGGSHGPGGEAPRNSSTAAAATEPLRIMSR